MTAINTGQERRGDEFGKCQSNQRRVIIQPLECHSDAESWEPLRNDWPFGAPVTFSHSLAHVNAPRPPSFSHSRRYSA